MQIFSKVQMFPKARMNSLHVGVRLMMAAGSLTGLGWHGPAEIED
jgi:hypothetical protein